MANKTVVITGANAGLGFQTALRLARAGARVVLACRSMDKARKAQKDLLAEVPLAQTSIIPLDLSEPASIREFGRQFSDQVGQLDILINNAGILAVPLTRNTLGHELQLATNYLGAFALTGTLLPLFPRDAPARIINVGSLGHRLGKLDLDDLNWLKTSYSEWSAYTRSKLALVSFTLELNRRLQQRSSPILAMGAHPGFAATNIAKHIAVVNPTNRVGKWFQKKMESRTPTAAQAAASIVHAAWADNVRGGEYYGPSGFLEIGGPPGKARIHAIANDAGIRERLWVLSESMTGVRYLSD